MRSVVFQNLTTDRSSFKLGKKFVKEKITMKPIAAVGGVTSILTSNYPY